MSKIAITGAATGTATFTIESPATSTNRTLTLPDATGTVVASGTTPSLNGITFPATQVASGGANTLDDYEEGTWTPNQGGGLTVVGAFSSAGSYIKVGRLVTITARLAGATSITTSAGSSISTNLPFTAENLAQAGMGGLTNNNIAATGATWISQNSTSIFATAAVGGTIAIFFNATYIATN